MRGSVLVTGASGFIGSALICYLADAGFRVKAAARSVARIPTRINIEPVIMQDLAGEVNWNEILRGTDFIVHLAGIAHQSGREDNYREVICRATESLARAANAADIKRLVYISSVAAQSGAFSDYPLTEASLPTPQTAYGRAKLQAEDAIKNAGAPYCVLRPALVYGPGVKGNMASLVRLAASPIPLPIGSLPAVRSLLAIENLLGAIEFVLTKKVKNDTFVVADESPVRVSDMIKIMRSAMGRSPRIFGCPPILLSTGLKLVGRADIWDRLGRDFVVDASKLRSYGWEARVETAAALRSMFQQDLN